MTLAEKQALLAAYAAAETAILTGAQEYRIGTRAFRRADLAFVAGERRRLAEEVAREQSPRRGRTLYIVPQ